MHGLFPLRGADGSFRWFLSRAVPIRDDEGHVERWFGTSTDVTPQRDAEETLLRAIALRDEFLSIASHELRTPLTALALQLDSVDRLLKPVGSALEEGKTTKLQRKLAVASKQADRLTALVGSLLDGSRIAAGRLELELELELLDVRDLVREVVERFEEEAERRGSAIVLHGRSEAVLWDRERVDQAVTNVLSNALRYGAGKPIEVRVGAEPDAVAISVKDHGIGIARGDVDRIFGRFERAVSATHYGGLGLGLYVAQQIVAAHGGHIDVESSVGEGTTFTVVLPRRPSAKARLQMREQEGSS